ncbi:MAG TPA: hypothetical protein VGB72_02850 [Acidobacteriota bacterium]
MKIIKFLPTFLFLLIILNIVFIFGGGTSTGLDSEFFSVNLPSKAIWVFTWGHFFLAIGLICLFIEVMKATRTSTREVYDHILSTLTFIVFLLEFILVKRAGSSVFLLLTLMSLFDVIAGFSITISTARRDISLDRDSGFIQPTT